MTVPDDANVCSSLLQRSSTILFEGWDAAGKGGAIRRLTAGIDARITRVIPVSAPTDEELAASQPSKRIVLEMPFL